MIKYEIYDENVSKETLDFAKSFLQKCYDGASKQYEDYGKIENLKMLANNVYYNNFVDRTQLKISLYKLHEFKMKKFVDERVEASSVGEVNIEKKEKFNQAKKASRRIINSLTKSTIEKYEDYIKKMKRYAVTIQRYFRGHLVRLINKMEIMNLRLEMDNKKANDRMKKKTIAKKRKSNI